MPITHSLLFHAYCLPIGVNILVLTSILFVCVDTCQHNEMMISCILLLYILSLSSIQVVSIGVPTVLPSVWHDILKHTRSDGNSQYNELKSNILGYIKLRTGCTQQQHHSIPIFSNNTNTNTSIIGDVRLLSKLPGICLWYYHGVLRNPLTGNQIVDVEGFEITQLLRHNHQKPPSPSSPILPHDSYSDKGVKCSYFSRKIFIYKQNNRVINEFRIRPTSPKRKMEPIKILNEIITMSTNFFETKDTSTSSGSSANSSSVIGSVSGSGRGNLKLITTIDWPKKRRLLTKKNTITSDISSLSFLDKLLNIGKPVRYNIISFVHGGAVGNTTSSSRRNPWISFKSQDSDLHGKSQEYYTISSTPLSSISRIPVDAIYNNGTSGSSSKDALRSPKGYIQYRRYGESPPWFALGKLCTTELNGYRYDHVDQVPKHIIQLIQKECPSFFPISIDSRTYDSSVWFDRLEDNLERYPSWHQIIVRKFKATE